MPVCILFKTNTCIAPRTSNYWDQQRSGVLLKSPVIMNFPLECFLPLYLLALLFFRPVRNLLVAFLTPIKMYHLHYNLDLWGLVWCRRIRLKSFGKRCTCMIPLRLSQCLRTANEMWNFSLKFEILQENPINGHFADILTFAVKVELRV